MTHALSTPYKKPGSTWLLKFLQNALERNLCTSIGCTTCGAMEFRQSLSDETYKALGKEPHPQLAKEAAFFLAQCLALLDPPGPEIRALRPAVMLILHGLNPVLGRNPLVKNEAYVLDAVLGVSWAGKILAGMREHQREVRLKRRDHERRQAPEFLRSEREKKRTLKAERHAKMLEKQKEKSKMWHEMNSPMATIGEE